MNRFGTRVLAVLGAPLLAMAVSALVWASPASGHEVTGIEANCAQVTVHFVNFPEAGVMVHIAATVAGHATVATDVLVKSDTPSAVLDITAATGNLGAATAQLVVDVTWKFHGNQHEQETMPLTCGTGDTTTTIATTTSTALVGATTSSTVGEESSTSTTMSVSSTTSIPPSSTSSSVLGGAGGSTTTASTLLNGAGGSSGTSGTLVEGASVIGGAPGSTEVLGASVSSGTGSGSLPFTGAATAPLLSVGVALLTAGAAAASAARRRIRART